MTNPAPDGQPEVRSALIPLREPLFRSFWIASIISNIGTWMQEVGEAWLMTSLTASPTLIGLLETSIAFPMFLFALPGGALADILDRRRVLIFTQSWMLVSAALLGVLALLGVVTPWILLGMTFLLSVGAAMNGPAWQASVPELVSARDLPAAIALGSAGFNVARALGPALGGLVVAGFGPWASFMLNAVSFLAVIVVLYAWKRRHHQSILPAERMVGAIRTGLRYVRYSPELRAVLVRTAAFIFFGSAMWATLPFVARHEMGLSSVGYGMLIGSFGAGAVTGAWFIARLRSQLPVDLLVRLSTVVFAALLLTVGYCRVFVLLVAVMFPGGIAWMALMSSLNTAAQFASPSWVRARAMAVYLMVFMGGFAAGSALWGFAASRLGVSPAMSISAAGAVLGIFMTKRFKLQLDESIDRTPSMHWAEPAMAIEPHPDHGPVMITVEYRVEARHVSEFSDAIHELSRIRRRDGAMHWGLYRDVSDPLRWVETFVVGSWVEHMRQHERVTVVDREMEDRVHSFHSGPKPPVVSHFIYANNDEDTPAAKPALVPVP